MIRTWFFKFDTADLNIGFLNCFKGAKNSHDLYILIRGFGGCQRFLICLWHLNHYLNMVVDL